MSETDDAVTAGEPEETLPNDRRREDRRNDWVALGDYSIPELRKALLTFGLLTGIIVLFTYMIHEVIVAAIAGIVVGAYALPFHDWLDRRLPNRQLTAIITITLITVPLIAILAYSWIEVSSAAEYLRQNRQVVAHELNEAIHRIPYAAGLDVEDELERGVTLAANQTGEVVGELQEMLNILVISIAVFLFTVFYILTDRQSIVTYVRTKIPGRYRELCDRVWTSIHSVTYGALYATFLIQLIKSVMILAMNVIFDVPLALVLAIISFFIGFFPIVGSWSVYVPTAIYITVFRNDLIGGVLMLTIGFLVITLFMSMYLRPKIAAEKARVLNFFWMFIALITGVYTFGLVGIVVGPVLIAVLKAVLDTVTTESLESTVPQAADT